MASLWRRLAPAAVLGGSAVALVTLFDPGVRTLTGSPTGTGAGATSGAGVRTAPQGGTSSDGTSGSSAAPAPCDSAQETTGPTVQTRWGPVQVAAVVAGGRVCQARAVVTPDGDQRSIWINAQAVPILDARASAAGVTFDAVSGATVTSEGYRSSLQALIDSLR